MWGRDAPRSERAGRPKNCNWWWVTVGLPVVVVVTVLFLATCLWSPGIRASDGRGDTQGPGWGFTHTQFSADNGDPYSGCHRRGRDQVGTNGAGSQPMTGWGWITPSHRPGQYDFRSLDRRMNFILRSGGVPVIVLCCAPGWMKGGEPWSRPTGTAWNWAAPRTLRSIPSAERRSGRALSLNVAISSSGTSSKGSSTTSSSSGTQQSYTDLYNLVYDAVKAVDSSEPGRWALHRVREQTVRFARQLLPARRAPGGQWTNGTSTPSPSGTCTGRAADFVVVDDHATTAQGAPV